MKKKRASSAKKENNDRIKDLVILGAAIVALVLLLFLALGLLFGGSKSDASISAASEQTVTNFAELKSMSEKSKDLEFRAEYTITYSPKIRNDTSSQTYYSKPGNFRIDIRDGNVSLQMYKLGDSAYACGEDNGNMSCLFIGDINDIGSDTTMDTIEDNLGNYDISVSEGRTILGIEAKCFSIKARDFSSPLGQEYSVIDKDVDMTTENCFSSDGIPLEASSAFSRMTITAISRAVPDSAFVLPSEPVQVNGIE